MQALQKTSGAPMGIVIRSITIPATIFLFQPKLRQNGMLLIITNLLGLLGLIVVPAVLALVTLPVVQIVRHKPGAVITAIASVSGHGKNRFLKIKTALFIRAVLIYSHFNRFSAASSQAGGWNQEWIHSIRKFLFPTVWNF